MAEKIRITPSELQAQANRLSFLSRDLDRINGNIKGLVNTIDSSLSSSFKGNLVMKGRSISGALNGLESSMSIAAGLLNESATTFQNVDTLLRNKANDGLIPPEIIPASAATGEASNVEVMTERQAAWEDFQTKSGFEHGAHWGWNNTYVESYKGVYVGGSQCYAMAHMMQIEMGGTGPRDRLAISDVSQIQVGDCVHYYYPGGGEHWVYVFDIQGSNVYIGEGNAKDWRTGQTECINYGIMDFSFLSSMQLAEVDRAY